MRLLNRTSARHLGRVRAAAAVTAVLTTLAVPGAVSAQSLAHHMATAEPAADSSWTVDLTPDTDDTGVRTVDGELRLDRVTARRAASMASSRAQGTLLSDEHDLTRPADRVSSELAAELPPGSDVHVDVRGLRDDGRWTEWSPAGRGMPADLEAEVRTVQARLILLAGEVGASPAVRSLRLTADLVAERRMGPAAKVADTFRIFATREGLVGGTTANGHVIRSRDHFVALPSRRGLAPRGTGDYTVRVCADNGRCEWAPVWDVGPWNTTDDHWNPPELRQSWRDLAHGFPQAQAAFIHGYNGGRDQFGRLVANPAGIDLADGTFWDGLQLRNNSWVTVSYLWTFPGAVATVRTPLLNVRSTPDSTNPPVGVAADHARVVVECTVAGQLVTGSTGTSDQWLRIGPAQFISTAWVVAEPGPPPC